MKMKKKKKKRILYVRFELEFELEHSRQKKYTTRTHFSLIILSGPLAFAISC